jgi:hypothetical protein
MIHVYEALIKKYGTTNQYLKCVEEMSELTKALIKYVVNKVSATPPEIEQSKADIMEEIADVHIMIEQLKIIYPGWESHFIRKMSYLSELINPDEKK